MKNIIEGYRQAINNDLEVIEILYTYKRLNILIFYHLHQALEKQLKMLYLDLKPEESTYSKIKKIGHSIEEISVELIILIGDEHIRAYKKFEVNDPVEYAKLVENIEFLKNTVKKENRIMRDNYVTNMHNYEAFLSNIYSKYEQYKLLLSSNKSAKPTVILSIGALLAISLFKMNNMPRYPEEDFNYQNLNILKSNIHLMPKLITIFKFWLDLIRSPNIDS
ncbi:hypothetical protein [Candidatus Nitrosocosmicus arcticus]|nr:hypothetical protein [Candidatus Nitrosocosmicus arcticus]